MLEIYKKVLTDFGSQCQAQALSGKKIAFTVFQLGDGEYTGEETVETLMKMTALKSQRQEFGISKMELSEGSDTIILTLIAINSEVNIGYNIREIGIFAKDANGTQGLYSICVAKKDKPDWMPAYNGIDPVTLVYRDYLRVGNAENISVDLNSGGLATEKMLEETATELRNEIETLKFDDYTEEGAEVPGARDAISAMVSGIKRPTMLSKIKAALMGLVTLGEMRALLVNNGLCTEPGKFFMDAAFGKTLQDQINEVNGDLQTAYLLKGGTPIPAGADLKSDAYKVPGNYYVPLTSVVSSLLNLPAGITDAFTLKVEKGNGTDYPKQTFREYSSQKIVVRTFNSHDNTWTDGVSYVRNSDLTPVSMTTTRTENPYVSATSFNRIVARKIGPNLLWVLFNVWIDLTPLPNSDDIVEIGKVNGISSASPSALINIPAQNGSGTILLDFSDNGVFKIVNQSGKPVSGFVRTSFVAVVNFS